MSDQHRIRVSDYHPLQRAGAHALAVLGGATTPRESTREHFDTAVRVLVEDAVKAASAMNTKAPDGFLLRCSHTIWPNSPINHPANRRRTGEERRDLIERWRALPGQDSWPGVPCWTCGHPAVGWYGKLDIPLTTSVNHRNHVPQGHEGIPLCHPCRMAFHAVPYASHLTGRAATTPHSHDETLFARVIRAQVDATRPVIHTGPAPTDPRQLAISTLLGHDRPVMDGITLTTWSNHNQDPNVTMTYVEDRAAEWLRTSARDATVQQVWEAMLADHDGLAGLARAAFHPRGCTGTPRAPRDQRLRVIAA